MGNSIKYNKQVLCLNNNKTFEFFDDSLICTFDTKISDLEIKEFHNFEYTKVNPCDKNYQGINFREFNRGTKLEFLDSIFNIHVYLVEKLNGFVKHTPLDLKGNIISNKSSIVRTNYKYIKIGQNYYERHLKQKYIVVSASMNDNLIQNILVASNIFKNNVKPKFIRKKQIVGNANAKLFIRDLSIMIRLIIMIDESESDDILKITARPIVTYLKISDSFIVSHDVLDIVRVDVK